MKTKFPIALTMTLLFTVVASACFAQTRIPLPAHSTDDYERPRPLFSALQLRYASVEADVYLVNGELLVGKDVNDLKLGRSLGNLYLEPLRLIVTRNNGQVYPETTSPLLLIVNIKTAAEATYQQLERALGPYERFLTRFTSNSTELGAVTVILGGNRPRDLMENQAERFSAFDGSLADLTSGSVNPNFMPLISDDWNSVFQWRGAGEMPPEERQSLITFAQLAHDNNVKLRFWASPDIPPVWAELNNAGVDLISANRIQELSKFLGEL
ncbi:MAG: hypothetical protein JKY98_05600 [Gammaproteobacteria bacterium]|nr:hypothetical protein [Gammaproteobacteria bacterium]